MASSALGTNSSRTDLTTGTSLVTMRDTVDWEMPRRSPRNSWVLFWRRYMHAISTARYSPHDFGRPTLLFHGFLSRPWTRRTSSSICEGIRPVVRWYRNGLSSAGRFFWCENLTDIAWKDRCLCDTPSGYQNMIRLLLNNVHSEAYSKPQVSEKKNRPRAASYASR